MEATRLSTTPRAAERLLVFRAHVEHQTASAAIVFTVVPPRMIPTLYVVLGSAGT
jgi:hypothetical protein